MYFNVSLVQDLALSAASRQHAIAVSSGWRLPFFALENVPRVRHPRSLWLRAINETLDYYRPLTNECPSSWNNVDVKGVREERQWRWRVGRNICPRGSLLTHSGQRHVPTL